MCLLTTQILPIKAKKDIVVYKVLEKLHIPFHDDNPPLYVTPYRRIPVEMGQTLCAIGSTNNKWIFYDYGRPKQEITSGYIHCYTSLSELLALHIRRQNEIVVKCIIPKGTKYYKSWDNATICAKQINILDEVDYFKD